MRATIPIDLSDRLIAELERIGKDRLPNEACGIIIPTPWRGRQIFEMPNRSMHPRDSFQFTTDDLYIELKGWVEATDHDVWNDIVIWHTHPAGGVGPSRQDMRSKIPKVGHLVVALTENGAVPTWY